MDHLKFDNNCNLSNVQGDRLHSDTVTLIEKCLELKKEYISNIQSVDGGYDQSKNWKVGRSDLSETERSAAPSLKGGEKKRVHTKSYPTSNRNNSGRVGPIYLTLDTPNFMWI